MSHKEEIINLIAKKSCVKQDVYQVLRSRFEDFSAILESSIQEIATSFEGTDKRLSFHYKEHGDFTREIKVAGDILLFHMHTNIFQFDAANGLWKTSYLKDDERNGYVGIINVYNFLADSFKYNRSNDAGYLIARIMVNRENHFVVQGKRQMSYLYNDLINSDLNEKAMKDIVENTILYTLDFDLYTPPYQNMQQVSVAQFQSMNAQAQTATGKRLGFKFSAEFDDEEENISA